MFNVNQIIAKNTLESLLQKKYQDIIPIPYNFCGIRIDEGEILLRGKGIIDNENNKCVMGTIDLINGNVLFREGYCRSDP